MSPSSFAPLRKTDVAMPDCARLVRRSAARSATCFFAAPATLFHNVSLCLRGEIVLVLEDGRPTGVDDTSGCCGQPRMRLELHHLTWPMRKSVTTQDDPTARGAPPLRRVAARLYTIWPWGMQTFISTPHCSALIARWTCFEGAQAPLYKTNTQHYEGR